MACRFDPATRLPFRPEALRLEAARYARELTAAGIRSGRLSRGLGRLCKVAPTRASPGVRAKINLSIELVDERRLTWLGAAGPDVGAGYPGGRKVHEATYGNPAGSRVYKLYIPSRDHGQALRLVVMLHLLHPVARRFQQEQPSRASEATPTPR